MLLLIVSIAIALSISFLCSISEAVLLSLTPAQVAELDAKDPALGTVWRGFKKSLERPIAVILVLNTAAHTIGASIAGAKFSDVVGEEWIVLYSLVFTFLMLQFTEILPKTMGVRLNAKLAVHLARPLTWAVFIMTPVIRIVHWLNRPFAGRQRDVRPPDSVAEIAALTGLALLSEQISSQQAQIITTASRLAKVSVQDAMIPVEQVSFLDSSQSLTEAISHAHVDAHTRFPVQEHGDNNHVVGYVNFKEMIYASRNTQAHPLLRELIHPVRFVEPTTSISELLRFFVDEHEHLAIVRDKGGRTQGLITLEDITAVMIGEIEDEFDQLPHYLHALGQSTWMIGGGTPIAETDRQLGMSLPPTDGTTSGWIMKQRGGMVKAGDTLTFGRFEFVVRRTRRGKVFEVSVRTVES